MFCASRDGPENLGFLGMVTTNVKVFCTVYDYAGKADLMTGFAIQKENLVITHFSEIIELQFGKKMSYVLFH